MSRDERRCISPHFGSRREEPVSDGDGGMVLFKSAYSGSHLSAAKSSLASRYPELLARCADDETALLYWPWFREFLIPILDGGPSAILIGHDPFSGARLPASLRDEWFDTLEREMGREVDLFDPDVPAEFQGEEWWIRRGL